MPAPTIHHGDCLEVLRSLPDASVDAVVTDPPYALSFMGKAWDSHDTPIGFQAWCQLWAAECLRVLKPGGHMLAFGGTRTWHRLACAVEDAGFEVRDSIAWMYGSGFPKSLDVSKAIDKAAGVEREVVGIDPRYVGMSDAAKRAQGATTHEYSAGWVGDPSQVTAPATDDARTWQGWGTALKPAFEPIVVARKPLVGTVAGNVLAHGTGALNIDGCRVEGSYDPAGRKPQNIKGGNLVAGPAVRASDEIQQPHTAGRWPANVILDEDQANALDQQSGNRRGFSGGGTKGAGFRSDYVGGVDKGWTKAEPNYYADSGGASRFFTVAEGEECDEGSCPDCEWETHHEPSRPFVPFDQMGERFRYAAKAPKRERPVVDGVAHPTVKPIALMRWLVRLVTPPGGTVLEPFAGSGTTVEACILEGFNVIAIEREADYLPLIQSRIFRAQAAVAVEPEPDLFSELDGEAS